jgi:hypothetical protein
MLANQVDLALCGFGGLRRVGSIGDGGQAAAQDALGARFCEVPSKRSPTGSTIKFRPPSTIRLILDEITADLTALGYPVGSASR